jgi:hypothetical protein
MSNTFETVLKITNDRTYFGINRNSSFPTDWCFRVVKFKDVPFYIKVKVKKLDSYEDTYFIESYEAIVDESVFIPQERFIKTVYPPFQHDIKFFFEKILDKRKFSNN